MAVAPTSLGNYMFDLAWHCHALYTIKSLEFNISRRCFRTTYHHFPK
jgi:hypothetical protein